MINDKHNVTVPFYSCESVVKIAEHREH